MTICTRATIIIFHAFVCIVHLCTSTNVVIDIGSASDVMLRLASNLK